VRFSTACDRFPVDFACFAWRIIVFAAVNRSLRTNEPLPRPFGGLAQLDCEEARVVPVEVDRELSATDG
jgi:hypothetical protein